MAPVNRTTTSASYWQPLKPAAGAESAGECRLGSAGRAWKGFGGCFNELGWKALAGLDEAGRDRVLRDLFQPGRGCNFTYCRVPIGASDYAESWYSHNEKPDDLAMEHFSIARDRTRLIPYIKSAKALQPDLFLFASPWSPPTWLKHPRAYNYGRLIKSPEYQEAYALYLQRFVEAYAEEGITIGALHVQNEPNSNQKFPSCIWTGTEMRDFIRDYLGPRFTRELPDCEIWMGCIERPSFNEWALTVLSDRQTRRYVAGAGYQWAGRGAVQRTRMAWPDLPIIQTENECGDGNNDWTHAHHVFTLLHDYIVNGVDAYAYWNMVLPSEGESTWGWKQNSMVSVDAGTGKATYNPEFYVMQHFAHYVSPGDRLVSLEGMWSANAVGFRRADGSHVCVIRNPLPESSPVNLSAGAANAVVELPPGSISTVVL